MSSWSSEMLFVLLVGVSMAYAITMYLTLRGFWALGVCAGLALLLAVVGWGTSQQALISRLQFSQAGPCWFGPEGVPVRSMGSQLCSWIAIPLYFFLALHAKSQLPASVPSPSRWQKIGVAIAAIVTVAGVIAATYRHEQSISRSQQLEHTSLLTEMAQVRDVITTAHLCELGSVPLSGLLSSASFEPPYVIPGGLRFSGDGRWLSLQYPDRVELWRVADLQVGLTLKGEGAEDSLVAFSPDVSLWAVWMENLVSVYALNDELSGPLWQVSRSRYRYQAGSMAFSAGSRELLLSGTEGRLSLDSRTGTVMVGSAWGPPKELALVLSPYGDYLATSGNLVQVYERRSGRLAGELRFPTELREYSTSLWGVSFVSDRYLLLWKSGYPARGALWNVETGTWALEGLDLGSNIHCGLLGLSPDLRLAAMDVRGDIILHDLSAQSALGVLPIDVGVTAAAFSPDQRLLAVAAADGRLRFFAAAQ